MQASLSTSSAQTVSAPTNHAELGKLWVAAQSGSAIFLWRFASGLLGYVSANAKETIQQTADGMGKSRTFVSRALKAARAFPNAPTATDDQTRFVDMFYGNEGKTAAQKNKTTANPADTGKGFIRAGVRSCLKGGMSAEEISAYVAECLTGAAADAAKAAATDPADNAGTVKLDSAKASAAARTQAKSQANQTAANAKTAAPQLDPAMAAHFLSMMQTLMASQTAAPVAA